MKSRADLLLFAAAMHDECTTSALLLKKDKGSATTATTIVFEDLATKQKVALLKATAGSHGDAEKAEKWGSVDMLMKESKDAQDPEDCGDLRARAEEYLKLLVEHDFSKSKHRQKDRDHPEDIAGMRTLSTYLQLQPFVYSFTQHQLLKNALSSPQNNPPSTSTGATQQKPRLVSKKKALKLVLPSVWMVVLLSMVGNSGDIKHIEKKLSSFEFGVPPSAELVDWVTAFVEIHAKDVDPVLASKEMEHIQQDAAGAGEAAEAEAAHRQYLEDAIRSTSIGRVNDELVEKLGVELQVKPLEETCPRKMVFRKKGDGETAETTGTTSQTTGRQSSEVFV
eukprot:g20425.t1